ncbi:MAG TPA: 2-dehydro-3-deoxygalactonokinase [Sphingomonadaceae bacterium]|jgi:2-dehydro-3-deoxygalactonokinase|nr:2-dehydro-3-deoxygalactonokinase [Sphingomonadaceae bacterium]
MTTGTGATGPGASSTGWNDGFISVDWGTTNRRAYLIGADGRQRDEMEDDQGILSVATGQFHGAVQEIRARLGDRPLLMGGMIGSNRGWVEAPYVACPAGIEDLAKALRWIEGGRAAIVPGVSYRNGRAADVMRGEEVQILGAVAAGTIPADCIVCHPGTHNKWIVVEGGRITSFRTIMTGELFSLLREHSILADLLGGDASPGAAFDEGVDYGLGNDDVVAELFSIRARVLLGAGERSAAASYASGLLIGGDARVGLRAAPEGEEIIVMGRPELTELFARAIARVGRGVREVDGEEAFVAGTRAIAELLR